MQSVILAAGMGKRLKDLTRSSTKCMVKVNGVTLIERMLNQLDKLSLSRIVIVVGYCGDILKDYIASLNISTPIEYVTNSVYDTTNNIYSLYLARDYLLSDDTLLLESDLIFEDEVLELLISDNRKTLALVDKYESWMDGTCVVLNSRDEITRFVPSTKFKYSESDSYYKTVNIYKFSKSFSNSFYVPFLEAYSKALGNNEYYEQVLRVITMLDEPEIKALRLNGQKWYEIDDVQDLNIASSIFLDTASEKYNGIQGRYGGYWRYPSLVDHSISNNPYYPPKQMLDEIKANLTKTLISYPSRNDINSLLVAKNLDIKESQVVVSNGVEELFVYIMQKISGPVGIVAPANIEYMRRLNGQAVDICLPDDFHPIASDIIGHYQNKDIGTLIIFNPNAYTGCMIPIEEIKAIIEWCRSNDIVLIIDETDVEYAIPYSDSLIGSHLFESYNKIICLKNLSSSHGVSGLRLGCAVSADQDFISSLRKEITIWNINSIAEFYLQIEEKYKRDFASSVEKLHTSREKFMEGLDKLGHIKVIPSDTINILCRIDPDLITANELSSSLLDRYNILIKTVPDEVIKGGNYIRISLRRNEENMKLLHAMGDILGSASSADRISDVPVEINDENVHKFFNDRTSKELPHRYNYVIYQDSNPQLALERDAYEKDRILPLLSLDGHSRVLDIGCGVGRWGDAIADILSDGRYIGVDYTEDFIKIARENLPEEKCTFISGSFQELSDVLKSSGENKPFDAILINGVLMYINDDDFLTCLKTAADLMNDNGVLYIKESVGINNRMTLSEHYSEELSHSYSAIYRSLTEYGSAFRQVFPADRYEFILNDETWRSEHKNRRDTTSWSWIIRKL